MTQHRSGRAAGEPELDHGRGQGECKREDCRDRRVTEERGGYEGADLIVAFLRDRFRDAVVEGLANAEIRETQIRSDAQDHQPRAVGLMAEAAQVDRNHHQREEHRDPPVEITPGDIFIEAYRHQSQPTDAR